MKKLIFIIIVLSLFMVGCSNPASEDYSDNVPVVDTENGDNGNSSNGPNNPGTNNGGNQDNPTNSGNGGTTTNPGNNNPTDTSTNNPTSNGTEGGNTRTNEKTLTFKLYEDSDLEVGNAEHLTNLEVTISTADLMRTGNNTTVSNLIESIKSKYNDYNERVVNTEYSYVESEDGVNYYFDENNNKISREITTKRNYESNYNIYYKDFTTNNEYNIISGTNFYSTINDSRINELSIVVKYTDSSYISKKVKVGAFRFNEGLITIPNNSRLLTVSEFMDEIPNLTYDIRDYDSNFELHEGFYHFENRVLVAGKISETIVNRPQYYTYSWITVSQSN